MALEMPFIAPSLLRRNLRGLFAVALGLILVGLLWRAPFLGMPTPAAVTDNDRKPSGSISKTLVVASKTQDNTSWLHEHLPDWDVRRFVVDGSSQQLTVPKNKGREAMVYLTYIIDAYDDLPDLMVFLHSDRYQWHNDDPLYDGVPMLQNLQIPHLISEGYTNLRCVWTLGCPSELQFSSKYADDASKTTQIAYPRAFRELFPNATLPHIIGVPCCAQFALTRNTIRARPRRDYQRFRQWLLDTELEDYISGRVFEYSWHIIFGKPPVHCPNAQECYCKTFGLCALKCTDAGKCGNRWPFPPSSTLPKGWPVVGWSGERRDDDVLEALRAVTMARGKPTA